MPIWYFSLNNMIKSIGLSWGKKGLVTLKIETAINFEFTIPIGRFDYKQERLPTNYPLLTKCAKLNLKAKRFYL